MTWQRAISAYKKRKNGILHSNIYSKLEKQHKDILRFKKYRLNFVGNNNKETHTFLKIKNCKNYETYFSIGTYF